MHGAGNQTGRVGPLDCRRQRNAAIQALFVRQPFGEHVAVSLMPEHGLIVERVDDWPLWVMRQGADALGLEIRGGGHGRIARVVARDVRAVWPGAITTIRDVLLYLPLWPVLRDRKPPTFRPRGDPGEHWNREVARQAGAIIPIHEVRPSARLAVQEEPVGPGVVGLRVPVVARRAVSAPAHGRDAQHFRACRVNRRGAINQGADRVKGLSRVEPDPHREGFACIRLGLGEAEGAESMA